MKWLVLFIVAVITGSGVWYSGILERAPLRSQVIIQPSKPTQGVKEPPIKLGPPHRVKIILKPDQVSYQFDTPVQVSARVYDRQDRELTDVEVKFITQSAYLKVNEFNDLEFRRAGRSELKACVKRTTGGVELCDQVRVMVVSDSSP